MITVKPPLKLTTSVLIILSFLKSVPAQATKDTNTAEVPHHPPSTSVKQSPAEEKKPANHKIAVGEFALGLRYSHGQGIEKNKRKAAECYQRAAEQGHHDALHTLSHMYEKGDGAPCDMAKFKQMHTKIGPHTNF